MELGAAGHDAHPVLGQDIDGVVGDALLLALGGGEAGAGRVPLEHLDAAGPDETGVSHRQAVDVVGGLPGLLLGRAGQLDHGGLAGQGIEHLHCITHRINAGVAGAIVGVYFDGAAGIHFKAGISSQGSVGADADGHYHGVALDDTARVQLQVGLLEGHHRIAHHQLDAVVDHGFLENLGHVVVIGFQDLVHGLHQGHLIACLP